jgi:hypothetical protein
VVGFPQHPDEHRPERPVLLAVLSGVQQGCGSVAGSPRLLAAPALRPGLDLPVLTREQPAPTLRVMPRVLERSTVLALAALVAFNVAMMVGWSAAGPSRDALVVAGGIAGDAVLCLIALFVTER